jgi:hypothetical protein
MKEGLREINDLVGTWGCLICNNQGGIIEASVPPGLTESSQENINRHVLDLFRAAGGSVEGLTEAVLHYLERKVFVFDLEKAFLIVFCTPSADISLLRMTVNLVLAQWEDDPKVQKAFQDHYVDRD